MLLIMYTCLDSEGQHREVTVVAYNKRESTNTSDIFHPALGCVLTFSTFLLHLENYRLIMIIIHRYTL